MCSYSYKDSINVFIVVKPIVSLNSWTSLFRESNFLQVRFLLKNMYVLQVSVYTKRNKWEGGNG